VPVIGDGVLWTDPDFRNGAQALERVYADPQVRAAMDIMTVHVYRPWKIDPVVKNGALAEMASLPPREVWQAMQAVPQINDQGFSVLTGTPGSMPGFALAERWGMPLAVTEWNWNGFGPRNEIAGSLFARGLAAGGFLHAFLRHGGIVLGCQSMLAGNGWSINSIHFPPERPPYLHPTAQVVGFYGQHHGDRVLATNLHDAPIVEQPLQLGQIEPARRFSLLDAVATRDDRNVYVHLINRSFDQPLPVTVEGGSGLKLSGPVTIHRLAGHLENNPEPDSPGKDRLILSQETSRMQDETWRGDLPARTITILVFPIKNQ
jgi:alpha-L-arabinofuranosidase